MAAGELMNPECVLCKVESHPGYLVNHRGKGQDDPGREQGKAPDYNYLTPNCQEVKITSIEEQ